MMELVDLLVTEEDVEKAYEVLKSVVKHTPLEYDFYLSEKYHCNVYLKREDLQRVRSLNYVVLFMLFLDYQRNNWKKEWCAQVLEIMRKELHIRANE